MRQMFVINVNVQPHINLFVPTQVQVSRCEYMGQCSESMEQHGSKLYDNNEREEEYEHQTYGFQMQVLFAD